MNERRLIQRKDLILIAILLALALLCFAVHTFINRSDGALLCQIQYNGELVKTVNLSDNQVFYLEESPRVRFEIKDNAVAFIESDCPDKVCIHSGFLSQSGQMAACLPNLVSIRIVAVDGQSDVDAVAN